MRLKVELVIISCNIENNNDNYESNKELCSCQSLWFLRTVCKTKKRPIQRFVACIQYIIVG